MERRASKWGLIHKPKSPPDERVHGGGGVCGAKSEGHATLSARVFHADGTVTDCGVIASNIPGWKRKVAHHGK